MTSVHDLMRLLSKPRPNGSAALERTAAELQEWCRQKGIAFSVHRFRIYPYFFEAIGIWLIASHFLLAIAVWSGWGWLTLPVALGSLAAVLLSYVCRIPLVTWPGAAVGENILIEFEPSNNDTPEFELIVSAHYDSKTEPLDHRQRMFLLKCIPAGILLALLAGVTGLLETVFAPVDPNISLIIQSTGKLLTIPMLFLVFALGLNLTTGRLSPQSCGAVDNGAACAIILGLAESLAETGESLAARKKIRANKSTFLQNTRLTLALFTGEEVDRQGSRAYARSRDYPLLTAALNLEAMGQDGPYVLWDCDGSIYSLRTCDHRLTGLASSSIVDLTGTSPVSGGPMLSDGAAFIEQDIPTAVLGTYDTRWRDRGFHKPSDNLDRVVPERLVEGVMLLREIVRRYDRFGLI